MQQRDKLERRINKYITRSEQIRPDLYFVLEKIKNKLPESVIFGGAIREFSVKKGYIRKFSSDIDIVSAASKDTIEDAIKRFNPSLNKFGGFRFSYGKFLFDIWSLPDTWAFNHHQNNNFISNKNKLTLNDLLKTTFFNMDAAIFHLSEKKLILSDTYDIWIEKSLIDINFPANPNPQGMINKAIKASILYDAVLSNELLIFILNEAKFVNKNTINSTFLKLAREHIEHGKDNFRFLPQLKLKLSS